ncbi:MAG: AI-2E family transporter [Myxococcaceae bacterium]|nr:AI-2E family transporter [Myxococcaceae bacterium]
MNETHPPIAIAFFMALFLAALAGLLYVLSPFLADLVLAFMFASLVGPLHQRLRAKWPKHPGLAAGLLTALVAVAVLVPLGFIGGSLSVQATAFYEDTLKGFSREQFDSLLFGEGWFARNARGAAETLGATWTPQVLDGWLSRAAGSVATFISAQVNAVVTNVLAAGLHFVLMLFIVFTMLLEGERLRRYAFATSPLPDDEEARLIGTFVAVARATFFGNGLGSLIQGVLGGLSMAVLGFTSWALWGAVMTVLAFLPLVGISLVTVPATVVLLAQGRYAAAAGFLAFNIAQGLFVENVVKTKLIGAQIQLPSLLIFLGIVGGLALFGVLGLVYGPLIVALFLTLSELYHQRYRQLLVGGASTPPTS